MTSGEGDAGGRLFRENLHGVDPVAAVMEADARRSIAAYPELVLVGSLFTSAERVPAGWQILCPCDPVTQGARELLADHLDDRASLTEGGRGRELRAAARNLRLEPLDELRSAGRRFRIIRVDQLVRSGPDGPEPPRPTDLDPHPHDARSRYPRPYELLPDGLPDPDIASAALLTRLLEPTPLDPEHDQVTPVLLAPAFTVAERIQGRWCPVGRQHETPQQARDSLATYFRHVVPAIECPSAETRAEYAEAADSISDVTRRNGITVAGRRFRVVRIERAALSGPDGPEPPRPTDPH
ncbi:DUF5954 family protein [Spirillospora sp. CA-294931]|uniref:DUF5954 family protein n=1 Tax=Spirillospora sp. CA-294931 TaxID=3240042 RepID=UPI003D8A30FF